jgi:hypothetical protein
MRFQGGETRVQVFATVVDGLPVYLLDGPPISAGGSVYSADPALDGDKYVFFSLAALEMMRYLDWRPNVVHVNDWHTSLACYGLLLRRRLGDYRGVASVLTLHNLPFMGPDISTALDEYGIAEVETGLPDWARPRPLPLGLWAADAIVAVSPSYAREIRLVNTAAPEHHREPVAIPNGSSTASTMIHTILQPIRPCLHSRSYAERRRQQVRTSCGWDCRSMSMCRYPESLRLDLRRVLICCRAMRRLREQSGNRHSDRPPSHRTITKVFKMTSNRVRATMMRPRQTIYAGADLLLMPSRRALWSLLRSPCAMLRTDVRRSELRHDLQTTGFWEHAKRRAIGVGHQTGRDDAW